MQHALFASLFVLVAAFAACSDDDDSSGSSSSSSSGSADAAASSSSSGQATSSSGGTSSSSGDAAATSSSSGGSGGACAGFAATGPEVAPTVTDGGVPEPVGGTLIDGTYELTAVTSYGGNALVSTSRVKTTLRIAGGTFVRGFVFTAFGTTTTGAEGGTFTSDGVNLVATSNCTDGDSNGGYGTLGGTYTATATRLVLFQDPPAQTGGSKITFTLDLQ